MILQIVMVLILWPSLALAADLYVDNATSGCSTPTDTDYNPNTRSCGSGSETVYSTILGACAVEAANDNIYVRGGTYAEYINDCLTSGSGPGFTNTTNLIGWFGETVTVRRSYTGGSACLLFIGAGRSSIVVRNINFNGDLCTTGGAPVRADNSNNSALARPSYIRFTNLEVAHSPTSSGFLVAMDNSEITYSRIHHNGVKAPAAGGRFDHGIYFGGGLDSLIAYNEIYSNTGWGINTYCASCSQLARIKTRYNYVHDNQTGSDCPCGEIVDAADTDTIEYNVVVASGSTGTTINLQYGAVPKRNSIVRHNSVYRGNVGISFSVGTGHVGQNNLVLGANTPIVNTAGATLTTNRTTGVATDIWTDPANGKYSLKAGSVAIGAGTNIGLTFNGSAPDQGAFETFAPVSASINGVNLDITLGMNGYTPPQGTGTNLGWTVTCIGTGCGTPTVSVVTVFSGASSILRATISGISGGSCAAGQTWLVHYDASLGAVSDSILIGNSLMQPMHSFTNFSVANACAGGGAPSYPASPIVYYPLDGNAVDSSGNGNTGIITGSLTFTTARHNDGYQTTAGATQYITVPYGNAVDPTTQSLTICVGVYITPGTESTVGLVPFGAPVGTNQRLYVAATSGTWRVAAQASNSGTASDLSVVAGWNRVCLEANSVTDQVTVYNNGVAATNAGGVKAITTFALAGNFELGRLPGTGNVSGTAIYDDFHIWTNTISIADDYAAWEPPSPTPGSYTFSQPAHRFQRVYLTNGAVEDISANNAARDVVEGGAVAIIFQINCDNVADCAPTSFALRSSDNGSTYTVVPNTPTEHGVSMWGASVTHLNSGVADGPLTGSLTHTDGTTQLTAENVPNVDLAQNTSLTLRYLVRFATGLAGQTRYFKIYDQAGNALAGGYTPSTGAQVNVVPMQASVGF